jgi:hypothetical protein
MFYRNGNFNSFGGKQKSGSKKNQNKNKNDDDDDNDSRRKRQYSYNPTDVQVPPVSLLGQQRVFTLPSQQQQQQQQYLASFNPIQVSSYGSVQPQQSRLIPTQMLPQLPAQRMLFYSLFCFSIKIFLIFFSITLCW